METLDKILKAHDAIPKRDIVGRLKSHQLVLDFYQSLVHNLQQRNNELIIADTVYTEQVGLLLEQRYMLFNVLSDIKNALDNEGRPNDPIVHMIFNIVETVKEMDNDWKEKVGNKSIKG